MTGVEAYPHLHAATIEKLALPKAERIHSMSTLPWIKYSSADLLENDLERLLAQPSAERMPCRMIVGAPNNGKTRLLNRFVRRHRPVIDLSVNAERLKLPVIMVQALDVPTDREFYSRIIQCFGNIPYKPSDHIARLKYKAEQLLLIYQVRIMIIDEFHTLASGSPAQQRMMLNIVKNLSVRYRLSIVAAGIREAISLLQLDTQFSTRFRVVSLPTWEGVQWRKLVDSMERFLPLARASGLAEPRFSDRLLVESNGTIGGVGDLLRDMTIYAIENDKSYLTPEMVKLCGWVRASDRVQHAHADMRLHMN